MTTDQPKGTTTIDLNKIMARVQALLAKADSTDFPEEATAYRAKAEQFMRDYRIAEEQLIAVDQVEIRPEVHTLWLGPTYDRTRANAGGKLGRQGHSYYNEWYSLATAAGRHAGARVHYRFGRNYDTNESGIYAVMVGYAGDLRLAELIYTNARLVFGERLEPKVDPSLSDQVNCYRLRSAGIARPRISEMLWGTDKQAPKVSVLYKRECALRGETPVLDGRGINAALYRDQFAEGFVDELDRRLWAARDAADSTGGALTLHGRKERVEEVFFNEFPELRPVPRETQAVAVVEESAGKEIAKPKRTPKPYWETAAGRRDWERRFSGTAQAGARAGKGAAREVALDRASNAQRVEESAPRTARGAVES